MSRCCQTPLVSVVVPIYNVEPYLRECVDSILAQTYQNVEIILVDDGATDGCPGICDEYDSKYPNVTAVHKLNGGLSDARNAGLALAKGEFVTFVDSDDWLAPQMIERCESLIRKYDADVCGVSFMKAFPGGKFHKNANFASGPECYNNVEALAKYLFNTNLTVCVGNSGVDHFGATSAVPKGSFMRTNTLRIGLSMPPRRLYSIPSHYISIGSAKGQ